MEIEQFKRSLEVSTQAWDPTPPIWDLPSPPLVLTSSGCHRNTYGWQAGSTHPTAMLSRSVMANFNLNLILMQIYICHCTLNLK